MYYVALIFFVVLAVLFIAGNIKVAYLLTQLGFSFEVMKFLLLEAIILTISILILHGSNYSTTGFGLGGIVLGIVVPTLLLSTRKKVDPKQRSTKPKYMSQREWNWRHYEIGRSDPADSGFGSW